FVLSRSDPV
ncbi:hypothetical protein CP03DC35_1112B, partial [Chlamydia psittaci 03DC35]